MIVAAIVVLVAVALVLLAYEYDPERVRNARRALAAIFSRRPR